MMDDDQLQKGFSKNHFEKPSIIGNIFIG